MVFQGTDRGVVLFPRSCFSISSTGSIQDGERVIHSIDFIGETMEYFVCVCAENLCRLFRQRGVICDHRERRRQARCIEKKKQIDNILRTQNFRYSQFALVMARDHVDECETIVGRLTDDDHREHRQIRIHTPDECRQLQIRDRYRGCLHYYDPAFLCFYRDVVPFAKSSDWCCHADSRAMYFTDLQASELKLEYVPSAYIEFSVKDPLRIELEPIEHVYTKQLGDRSVRIDCLSVTSALATESIGFRSGTSEELALGICFANPHIAKRILGPDVVTQPEYRRVKRFVSVDRIEHFDQDRVFLCDKSSLPSDEVYLLSEDQAARLSESITKYVSEWAKAGPAGTIMHHMIEELFRGAYTIESRMTSDVYFIGEDGTHDFTSFNKSINQPPDYDRNESFKTLLAIVEAGNRLFTSFVDNAYQILRQFSCHFIPEIVLSLGMGGNPETRNVDDIDKETYISGSTDGIFIPRSDESFLLINKATNELISLSEVEMLSNLMDWNSDFGDNDTSEGEDLEDDSYNLSVVLVKLIGVEEEIVAVRVRGLVLIDWKSIKSVDGISTLNGLLNSPRMPDSWRVPSDEGIINVIPSSNGILLEIKAKKLDKYFAQEILYLSIIKAKFRFKSITPMIIAIDEKKVRAYVPDKALVDAWDAKFLRDGIIKRH